MAESKSKKSSTAGDGGQAEVEAKLDEAQEKGYIGTTPDPYPNEAYSLETDGAVSPGVPEARAAVAAASEGDESALNVPLPR